MWWAAERQALVVMAARLSRRGMICAWLASRARRLSTAMLTLVAAPVLASCANAPTDGGDAPRAIVLWNVPTPPRKPSDGLPVLAASGTGVFIGYQETLTALRARDGAILWQRTGIPTFRPVVFGDSVVAVLSGGSAIGISQRTGNTLWSYVIPGPPLTSQPTVAGPYGVFGNIPGELWAIEGLDGGPRRLATMAQLSDTTSAAIWGMTSRGDTVFVFIQRDHPDGEFGDFFLTRVLASSGQVLSRSRIARLEGEFPENRPVIVADSVAVLPISGCGIGVDTRTGLRLWRQCGEARVLRDGLLYAAGGVSDIIVTDPATGVLRRTITTGGASLFDVYPCREGLTFTAFLLGMIDDRAGARARQVRGNLQDDLYTSLAHHGTTLYAHDERTVTALYCS